MDDKDIFIKEGDIVLIDSKDDNSITEVKITDISPSGEYIEVSDLFGHTVIWVHMNRHLETLRSSDEDDSEYVDVDEDEDDLIGDQWKTDTNTNTVAAQDILAKIRNRNGEFDVDEPIEAEVITQNTLAEFDRRNKKK